MFKIHTTRVLYHEERLILYKVMTLSPPRIKPATSSFDLGTLPSSPNSYSHLGPSIHCLFWCKLFLKGMEFIFYNTCILRGTFSKSPVGIVFEIPSDNSLFSLLFLHTGNVAITGKCETGNSRGGGICAFSSVFWRCLQLQNPLNLWNSIF